MLDFMSKFKIEDMTVKLKGVPIQSIGKNMCDEVSFVKKERLDKMMKIMNNKKIAFQSSLWDTLDKNQMVSNGGFDSDVWGWNEAKTQVPIDTFKITKEMREHLDKITAPKLEYKRDILGIRDETTKFKDMSDDELVDIFVNEFREFAKKTRYDLPMYAFELPYLNYNNKGENKMVGLPYSVNFKKERNRTTLVWRGAEVRFSDYWHLVSEEYYEATKSEAHNEKFNYLFGFLMAYFKRVHKEMSKTQRKKYLNMVLYPMTQMQQVAFLKGVFYENCRLNYKEATSYLEKIAKGVEFEDGKEKTK